MNKFLAGYIFNGDTLFAIKEKRISAIKPTQNDDIPEASVPIIKSKTSTQKLLVLAENIKPQEKEMLIKILGAAKYSLENTDIFDLNSIKEEIKLGENTAFVISFGVDLAKINLQSISEKYKTVSLDNTTCILSDSLSIINANLNDEKKALWQAIKQMFNI